jgi:hypothetical protein
MKLKRLGQGIVLAVILFSTIVLVLGLAQSASQVGKLCLPPLAQLKWPMDFPRWIGCAMAAYENLAGGVIGAAGVLFPAWLAWIGVRDQIELEKEGRADAERREREAKIQTQELLLTRAKSAVSNADLAVRCVGDLVEAFADANPADASTFVNPMRTLDLQGRLANRYGGGLIERVNSHLAVLRLQAEQLRDSGRMHSRDLERLHDGIRRHVQELRDLRGELEQERVKGAQEVETIENDLTALRPQRAR